MSSPSQPNIHRSTVPPRSTHETYHPGGYGVSEGLKRARKPYLVPNLITGGLILTFATSVYFYSIAKVKQDDFSDLDDLKATGSSISATLPATSAPAPIGGAVPSTSTTASFPSATSSSSNSNGGILSSITSRLPSFGRSSSSSTSSIAPAGIAPSPDVQPSRSIRADSASLAHEKTRSEILARQGRLV